MMKVTDQCPLPHQVDANRSNTGDCLPSLYQFDYFRLDLFGISYLSPFYSKNFHLVDSKVDLLKVNHCNFSKESTLAKARKAVPIQKIASLHDPILEVHYMCQVE